MSLMLFLKAGLGDDGKFDISAGRGYNPRYESDEWHCGTTPDAPGNKRRGGLVHRDRTARQRGEISRRPRGGNWELDGEASANCERQNEKRRDNAV